jgi:hypothetical protein
MTASKHNYQKVPASPQTKLTLSSPADTYEQQADDISEHLMRVDH